MYYRLEVELAYLVDFVQFLLWFALHFTFLHSELQPYTLWNQFFLKNTFEFFFSLIWPCTSRWQDLRRLRNDYKPEVQLAYLVHFAKFRVQFVHFTFLHSKLVLHSLESYLVYNLWLAGSLNPYKILEVQLAHLINFAQFLSQSALHFTFWHSILVLHYIGIIIFSRISSCSLAVYLPLLI